MKTNHEKATPSMTTQPKTEATPRPWHVKIDPGWGEDGTKIYSKDDHTVASTSFRNFSTNQANAAFIVTAVNEHSAHLALEEAVRKMFQSQNITTTGYSLKARDALSAIASLRGKENKV